MKLKHLSLFFLLCCSTTDTKADSLSAKLNSAQDMITTGVDFSNLNSVSFTSILPQSPNYIYTYKSFFDLLQLGTIESDILHTCEIVASFRLQAGDYCNRVQLDDSDDCILDVTQLTFRQNIYSKFLMQTACRDFLFLTTSI